MKWIRVTEHGSDACHLLPDPGETDRMIVAAVAAASFNSAWPEGYGWEQWDPLQEATLANARTALSGVFRDARQGRRDEVLSMDYVGGRRCKTYISRETHGASRGRLRLDVATFEATRGDVERLLMAAEALLAAARRRRRARSR